MSFVTEQSASTMKQEDSSVISHSHDYHHDQSCDQSHDQKKRCSVTLQNQDIRSSKHQTSLIEMNSNVYRSSDMNLQFTFINSSD